jgi:hypothetical protein
LAVRVCRRGVRRSPHDRSRLSAAVKTESGTHAPMSERLVELEEILRTLRDDGPRSSDAVARELGLHTFDVRLALLDAAIWGLIRRDRRGAWTLTDRGLALLLSDTVGGDGEGVERHRGW